MKVRKLDEPPPAKCAKIQRNARSGKMISSAKTPGKPTHLLALKPLQPLRKPRKLAVDFAARIYYWTVADSSQFRQRNPVAVALWANALLLAGILVVLLGRSGSPTLMPVAFGQDQSHLPLAPQPIAGGAGLFLMPAQFATNIWGCYVMDVDRKTLCAYRYDPSEKQLFLVAARGFQYDLELKNFNTGNGNGEMSPAEVEKMAAAQKQDERVKAAPAPAPPAETPQKSE
jgi:hypothetical protein